MIDALILVAGKGSRLGALAADCPKPLLPIGGRPALLWILDWLRGSGVARATLNPHHCPGSFYRTIGTAYCGMEICYREEQELLGSAGTLRRYLAAHSEQPALVVYGDVLTTLPVDQLVAFHTIRPIHPCATLAVHAVSDPRSGGVVTLADDTIVAFEEKPARPASSFVFAGVAVLDPAILGYLPEHVPSDLGSDVFPSLCGSSYRMYAFPLSASDYLLDFGTPARYAQACREWADRVRPDAETPR
jgi:mannose-1-phosphate guanylyltransferase